MTSLAFSPSPRLRPRLEQLYALWHEKNEGTIRTMLFQELVERLAEQVNHDQQWQGFLKTGEEKRGVQVAWGRSERKDVTLHDADIPWDSFRAKQTTEEDRLATGRGEPVTEIHIPHRMLDRLERHLAWAQRWILETHPADIPAEWAAKIYDSFEEWFHDEVEKYVDRELSKLEEQQEKDEVAELYPELARNREKNKPRPPAAPVRPDRRSVAPAVGRPSQPGYVPESRGVLPSDLRANPDGTWSLKDPSKWEPPLAGRSVNPHAPHRKGPTSR